MSEDYTPIMDYKEFDKLLADQNYIPVPDTSPEGITDGNIKFIPKSAAKDFTPATQEQIKLRRDKLAYGTDTASEFGGGALGAFHGLTAGFLDPALPYLAAGGAKLSNAVGLTENKPEDPEVYRESIQQLKDQNKKATFTGDVIGTVAPAILSGGTSLLGNAAKLTAPGAISVGGKIIAQAMGKRLEEAAVKSVGDKILTQAVAAGAEGAIYGAGKYVSQWGLEKDKDFNVLGMLDEAGTSAIAGFGLSGLLGAGTSGAKQLGKQAWQAITSSPFKDTVQTISDSVQSLVKKVYSKLAGVPREKVEELMSPLNFTIVGQGDELTGPINEVDGTPIIAKIFKQPVEKIKALFAKPIRLDLEQVNAVTDAFSKNVDDISKASDEIMANYPGVENDLKKSLLEKPELVKTAKENIMSLADRARNMSERIMEKDNGIFGKDIVDALDNWSVDFEQQARSILKQPANIAPSTLPILPRAANSDVQVGADVINLETNKVIPRQLYDLIGTYSEKLGNIIKFMPNESKGSAALRFFRKELIDNLKKKDIWGDYAELTSDLGLYHSEAKDATDAFLNTFGVKGKERVILDTDKLTAFLKDPFSKVNERKAAVFNNYMESVKQFVSEIKTQYSNEISPAMDDIKSIRYGAVLDSMHQATEENKFFINFLEKNRLWGDLPKRITTPALAFKIAKGAAVGSLAGHFIGSQLSSEVGLGYGFGGGVVGAAFDIAKNVGANPDLAMATLRQIQKNADKLNSISLKALDNFARGIAPAAVKAKEYLLPDDIFNQAKDTLGPDNISSQKMDDNLNFKLAAIHGASPELGETLQNQIKANLQFLSQKLPKQQALDPAKPDQLTKPNKTELNIFANYYRYVDKPSNFFEDLNKGIVNDQGKEVMQTLYPAVWQKVITQVSGLLQDPKAELTLTAENRLRSLIGLNMGDPQLAKQIVYTEMPKQPEQRGKKISETGKKNISKSEEL